MSADRASTIDAIKDAADDVFDDVVSLRRRFHRHPELALEEYDTAGVAMQTMRGLDFDRVEPDVHETGVLGTLRGGRPGPTLLLRADMDALPIQEETGLDFASETEGVMHACGHDAHTASLLGTAMILARMRDRLHGTVRFCFQPSEERIPGGAKFMIEEGVLDAGPEGRGVDAAYGQHVAPDLPTGTIGVRAGMYMASADEVHVTIHGEGGHAAEPHLLGADATYAASQVVGALQSVVSRRSPPSVPSVLTIGRLAADGATNVIPKQAVLEGTFRTMDEEWRFEAHDHIRRVITRTAEAHGASADVEVRTGYPALYNHEAPTALVHEAAVEYVGPDRTVEVDPWFAGEDFAYFLQERPGAFYRLGTGSEAADSTHGLHTSRFTVDENALRTGPGFMAYLAWRFGAARAE
jgi:hippurate hydrolase